MSREKIAAIVPAYNEAKNIRRVLEALIRTPLLHEIIVIDDGSTDGTSEEVKKFPEVKLIRNEINQGKAQALDQGVKATDAQILFFSDADLRGLTPEIVEAIIRPVLNGKYAMFIGVRDNIMQKSVKLFAKNSGERALRREVWEALPNFFKHRFRVEAGLNHIARKLYGGFGWEKFLYYQTVKEKKYGFLLGTLLRWKMNFDVGIAYAFCVGENILHFFSSFGKMGERRKGE